jgi:hypothetical protein
MGKLKGEQMLERRDTKRIELTTPITLCVEELEVRTRMLNYSDDGALFKIDPADENKVSTDDLGKEATFVLKVKNKPDREYTGEIIRFFFQGDDKYIALRFWDPYRELA